MGAQAPGRRLSGGSCCCHGPRLLLAVMSTRRRPHRPGASGGGGRRRESSYPPGPAFPPLRSPARPLPSSASGPDLGGAVPGEQLEKGTQGNRREDPQHPREQAGAKLSPSGSHPSAQLLQVPEMITSSGAQCGRRPSSPPHLPKPSFPACSVGSPAIRNPAPCLQLLLVAMVP